MRGINEFLNLKTIEKSYDQFMETGIVTGKVLVKRNLPIDVMLWSVTDVRWRLEKFAASTGVHVTL